MHIIRNDHVASCYRPESLEIFPKRVCKPLNQAKFSEIMLMLFSSKEKFVSIGLIPFLVMEEFTENHFIMMIVTLFFKEDSS